MLSSALLAQTPDSALSVPDSLNALQSPLASKTKGTETQKPPIVLDTVQQLKLEDLEAAYAYDSLWLRELQACGGDLPGHLIAVDFNLDLLDIFSSIVKDRIIG